MRATAVAVLAACPAACDGDAPPPTPLALRPIVAGEAQLAGFAAGGCNRGETPGGDGHRWCAFFRASPEDAERKELWVVDVTAAMSGEPARCNGSSPGCVRLTDRLFTGVKIESPSHPEAHRFEGDTLLFLAEASPQSATLDRYEGPLWAWRPGWKRARALTTDRGVHCRASDTAPVAYCVDGVSDRPRLEFDLRVGRLADAEASVLPVVERIVPLRQGDLAWSAAFSPQGDLFAYSSWREGEAAQALRVVSTAGAGTEPPRTVIEDGRHFGLSFDGRSVYFLRGGSRPQGRGDLWAADFPGGEGAAELARGVFSFSLLGRSQRADGGVLFVTEMRGLEGVLRLLPDRRRPAESREISRDAHFWYASPDGRFTYVLEVTRREERGVIVDNQRGSVCRLGSGPDRVVYNPTFLPRLDAVLWTEEDPDGERELSFLGRPGDCSGVRPLGPGLLELLPLGDKGALFVAKRAEEPPTLFHAPVFDERPLEVLGAPVLADIDMDNLTAVGAGPDALVVGTRATAPEGRGLFVFGPLARPVVPPRRP